MGVCGVQEVWGSPQFCGGRTAMRSTATALARARARVWRAAVVQGSAWEKGAGERGPGSSGRVDALSCPGRADARPGTFWARRARRVPGGAGFLRDHG
jgi:hypothetical protein